MSLQQPQPNSQHSRPAPQPPPTEAYCKSLWHGHLHGKVGGSDPGQYRVIQFGKKFGRNQLGTFAIMAALQISQIAWVRSGLLLQVASLNTHRNSNGSLLCISAQPKTVCSLGFRPYLPSKTLQHYHIWRTNCILV